MKCKTCSEYKDTGIKWLGVIPEHWEVKKIKYTSVLLNGYAFDSNSYVDTGVPIIRIGDVGSEIDWNEMKRVPSDLLHILSRFRVLKGDILIALTGATIGKNSVFKTDKVALLNQRVGVIRGLHIEQGFLKYVVCSDGFKKAIDFLCYGGAQDNIGKGEVGNISTGLPPLSEQRAIADFLDRETERIDTLIAKKERQIELLQEKRAALISHVVTKGLNPNVKMKDSGIEWLGQIPDHWVTISIKRKFEIQLGKMLQNGPESDADVSVPYIKALHVLWGKVDTSDLPEMWASTADLKQYGVKRGDLLVCEGGEAGRAGIVESSPCTCIIQNAVHRVRGKNGDVRFLQYMLHAVSTMGWFDVLCNKATIAHFTREKLSELRIPLPPSSDEQRSISTYLDGETSHIDTLISKIQNSIRKLREYRTVLISAAVTGKIDVRKEVV